MPRTRKHLWSDGCVTLVSGPIGHRLPPNVATYHDNKQGFDHQWIYCLTDNIDPAITEPANGWRCIIYKSLWSKSFGWLPHQKKFKLLHGSWIKLYLPTTSFSIFRGLTLVWTSWSKCKHSLVIHREGDMTGGGWGGRRELRVSLKGWS